MKIRLFVFLFFLLLIPLSLFLYSKVSGTKPETETLSAVIEEPTLTPTPSKKPSPTPSKKLSKGSYTIAAFGDSMIDTMGEDLDYLSLALKKKYPGTNFKLLNFGIGAENVEKGLARWNSTLTYKERNYPPITQVNADIIILGSFSYNTFDPHDVSRHREGLKKLIEEARITSSDVYLLLEIAPLAEGFGQGKNGPNMLPADAIAQSNRILEQLDDSLSLGKELGISLINVYTPSQLNGRYGEISNVNQDDGIHPSGQGHELTARIIVSEVKLR
ncbi:MAG: SGNH/GDSL hydrolase family protein [Patescibacteria group bacterium]